jgi:hypothetical protein
VGDDALDNDGLEAPARRWHGAITWAGLATAAFILYELTNEPAVGVATLCLKFGWEDFKTGYWLRRVDPNRARGRACWWMCVAWGLWKASLVAFATGMGTFVWGEILEGLGNVAARQRMWLPGTSGLISAAAGMGLSSAATAVMVWIAYPHRVPLWLHSSTNGARRKGLWPPYDPDRVWKTALPEPGPWGPAGTDNQLYLLFVTTGQVPAIMAFFFPVILENLKIMHFGPNWVCLMVVVTLIVVTFLLCVVSPSIVARCPAECWPPDELAAVPDDPLQ